MRAPRRLTSPPLMPRLRLFRLTAGLFRLTAGLLGLALALLLPSAGQAQTPPEPPEPPQYLAAPSPPAESQSGEGQAAPGEPGTQTITLVPIPQPDLTGLETRVAEELGGARELVQSLLAQEGMDPVTLGRAFGDLGLLYHAHDLTDAAAACYENARRLLPGAPQWTYALGYLAQQNGELELARKALTEALEMAPDHQPALFHLGELELLENHMEEAKKLVARLLEEDPGSPAGRALAGEIAYAAGDYEAAVKHLEAALLAVPAANRLRYPLAMSYRRLGDIEKAQENLARRGTVGIKVADPFEDALAERAVGERVHLLVGQVAYRAGRFPEAAEAFRRAVEAEPESARARVNLASALGGLGDQEGAVRELREALRLDPANTTARFNLGSLQMGTGELAEAEENFRAVLAASPNDVEAHLALGRILRGSGRPSEALPHYQRASELAPFNEDARLGEAQLLIDAGRVVEAKESLEDAFSLAPESGRVAHALSRLLAAAPDLALRDGARAVELAALVFQAAPTAVHAETLAMALAEAGRCAEATTVQERAITLAGEGSLAKVPPRMLADFERYRGQNPCRVPGAGGEAKRSEPADG